MNELKAINILKGDNELMLFDTLTGETKTYESLNDMNKAVYDANLVAIKALEKQIPKKPIALQHGDYRCPSCNRIIRMFEAINFCMFCGQAIDWSDEE